MARDTQVFVRLRTTGAQIMELGRASEWWEYKIVPALMVGYATSLCLGSSPWMALNGLGLFLIALLPGGIFVGVLNDWADRAEDALAGKPNRLEGKPPWVGIVLIVLCLAAGGAICWFWRDQPLLVATYLTGWLSFALYSLPPFRFKSRGIAGILCDATGAHLVPSLLAALVTARALGMALHAEWVLAVGCWALLYGLRGILWHQIGDLGADQSSRTHTFVARYGKSLTIGAVHWLLFPLELCAIAAIVIQTGPGGVAAACAALLLYGGLEHGRYDRFDMSVTIVEPRPRSSVALLEYYGVFLPLALLVLGIFRDWETLAILLLHGLLFPARCRQICADVAKFADPQYVPRSKRS